MDLTEDQRKKIVESAHLYLGIPRSHYFKCVDFVREVYRQIGIELPPFAPSMPPAELRTSSKDMDNLPIGELVFLKNRKDMRDRAWSHVGISVSKDSCIHCSYFYGKKVVLTSTRELLEKYDFVGD